MQKNRLKLHVLGRIGILAGLTGMASVGVAAPLCSSATLAGSWSFNESGTGAGASAFLGPWSEIGSFTARSSATGVTGSGVAVITAPNAGLVGQSVPLNPITINSVDPSTCIGTASFGTGTQTRTITFTITSPTSFDYISTVGDLAIVGHGQKRNPLLLLVQ